MNAEVVVLGSGPGGAVTACLLAEAGRDVLLIEEGPALGLDSCEPFRVAELEQKYRNGGLTAAMGPARVQYVEARCLGGGSEINSGLYHRTPPEVLERWKRDFGLRDASPEEMGPHFEACESDLSVALCSGTLPAASLKLHAGALSLGWKCQEVPRWFRFEAGGRGRRQSMTETFIPRAKKAGCRLLAGTRANGLRSEGGRWTIRCEGAVAEVRARVVFVCGGAIQTPALLRRSGICGGVGDALQLHPTVKMVARFPEEVNHEEMGVPVHQVHEFSPRYRFGCSISTPSFLSVALHDHPRAGAEVPRDWRRMAVYYAMIESGGVGSVRPIPGFRDPLVRYRLAAGDLGILGEAMRRLAETLFAAGAETVWPCVAGGIAMESPADLARLPAEVSAAGANLMTIHLLGTGRMGEDAARCPVDSFGGVRGCERLYVNDASLLCTAPTVNPQGSIMAFARRNALRFLGGL